MKKLLLLALLLLFSGCGQSGSSEETLQSPENNLEILQVKNFSAINYQTFSRIKKEKNAIIIDIRTPGEIAQNALPERDLEMDFYSENFIAQLDLLDKNVPYLLYCRSGNRTEFARKQMQTLGFTEVYDLKGGITALQ